MVWLNVLYRLNPYSYKLQNLRRRGIISPTRKPVRLIVRFLGRVSYGTGCRGSAAGGYEGQPLKAGGAAQPGAALPALCLWGAGGLGFVHGNALFRGWVGDFGGVVHEIRLFHG